MPLERIEWATIWCTNQDYSMNMCKDVKGREKKKRGNGRRVAPHLIALVCGVLTPGYLLPYPKAAVADLLLKYQL